MEKTLELIDEEGLQLSQSDLDQLTLSSGKSVTEPNAIFDEEAMQPVQDKRRQKSLTTGHKLKIVSDFKNGLTQEQLCKKHNLTATMLAAILSDPQFQELTNSTFINSTKKMMSSRFYQLADLCLNHIDFQKLDRLDPYKLGVLASIALDKARLIEGQSTENLSFKSLGLNIVANLDQLKERKMKLLEMLREKQGIKIVEAETIPH